MKTNEAFSRVKIDAPLKGVGWLIAAGRHNVPSSV